MSKLLLACLAVPLLLVSAPCFAQEDELPRHRPRLTDPTDSDDEWGASRNKRPRSHAMPIESDDSGWDETEKPTVEPSRRQTDSSARASDGETYAPRRDVEVEAEKPPRDEGRTRSRRRTSEDGDDWRDEPPRRTTRTAEEELRWEENDRPRRLANRDEPGYGLAAELSLGAVFLDDPAEGSRGAFAWGISFAWQLGRMFAPENRLLHKGLFLEVGYRHPLASTEGTDAVKVTSSQHDLWLAVLFGYPLKHVLLYGKLGPGMFIQPVSYDVQGTVTEWSGVKGGVVYGIGARTSLYLNEQLGLSVRLELTRNRRQYLDDTQLTAGLGAAF